MPPGSGDSPIFFVDRCLGRDVCDSLRAAGAFVEYLDDHFPIDAKDTDWLPETARRGWAVLTKDKRIRRSSDERQALLDHGVRYFALTSGNLDGAAMARLFVAALPAMSDVIGTTSGAVIAIVKTVPPGEVEVLVPA